MQDANPEHLEAQANEAHKRGGHKNLPISPLRRGAGDFLGAFLGSSIRRHESRSGDRDDSNTHVDQHGHHRGAVEAEFADEDVGGQRGTHRRTEGIDPVKGADHLTRGLDSSYETLRQYGQSHAHEEGRRQEEHETEDEHEPVRASGCGSTDQAEKERTAQTEDTNPDLQQSVGHEDGSQAPGNSAAEKGAQPQSRHVRGHDEGH